MGKAKKLLTAEEIQAKKNVDQSRIVELDGEKFDVLEEPRGIITKTGDDYSWELWITAAGEPKRVLSCDLPFETPDDARRHCRRLMGVAWNLEVRGYE